MILILPVSCANDCFDAPNVFVAEIDDADIERIRELSKVCEENDIFRVEEFRYIGEYYEFLDPGELTEEDLADNPHLAFAVIRERGEGKRTECDVLRVTKDDFYFACYPKHGSAAERLETAPVRIADLDKGDDIVDLENGLYF